MEGLKEAVKNAQKTKPMDIIARDYGVSVRTLYSLMGDEEPKQIRIREAMERLIRENA